MLILVLLLLVVFVSVVARVAERNVDRTGDQPQEPTPSPASQALARHRARREARRAPATPSLPEGHRPPAGLGPLSPSERFLRTESTRGIRALQLWLLDQDGAAA